MCDVRLKKSMTPKNQNRRIAQIAFFGILLLAGTALIFTALRQNLQHFYHPSQVLADDFVPKSEIVRVGGIVVPGSIETDQDLTVRFAIVDYVEDETGALGDLDDSTRINVSYQGLLPDLFNENEIAVVTGEVVNGNVLQAKEVLAKHDENYKPVLPKKK